VAKPDLERVYVTASGQAMRDDGMGSLSLAFSNLPLCADDTAAAILGIPVGGIYVLTSTAAITRRII